VELSRAGGGVAALADSPAASRWYEEVLAQRRRLLRLGHPEAIAPYERAGMLRRWIGAAGAVVTLFVIWAAIRSIGAA
jgi:protease PrsW